MITFVILFPQWWILPVYTVGPWLPVGSRDQKETTSCGFCPCFCQTIPTSSVEKGNLTALLSFYWKHMTLNYSLLNYFHLFFYVPKHLVSVSNFPWIFSSSISLQRSRSLRFSSGPWSWKQGGRSNILYDISHHHEGIAWLYTRFKNGPRPGSQYQWVHEPQSVCLQVRISVILKN